MKEIKSKFIENNEGIMTTSLYKVQSPAPNVESFEQYHYLMFEKRIVYEKYETGMLPKGVTINSPNFRHFIQSPDKELVLKDSSVIKVIFDCDNRRKKYSLTVIEFLEYKKIELSSTSMRKMIEILCKEDGFIKTDLLVKKTGFKNVATLRASKRRLNSQIRKAFGTAKDFIDGEQDKGYRISESFLVLKKS